MTSSPTTHPTTVPTTAPSSHWKWIAGILAVVLAVMILAVGTESYYLYRAWHGDLSPTRPSLVPSLPRPGAPSVHVQTPSIDDWSLAAAPFATGGPWEQLNRLHQQMDQLFNDTVSQFPDSSTLLSAMSSPNLDVREENDHYTVRADMPGADKASIKVNVEGRVLTISGERNSVNETKDQDKVIRSERSMAQFVRSIELPGPVKAEAVDAKYDNGVLTLNLPKGDQSSEGTNVPVH